MQPVLSAEEYRLVDKAYQGSLIQAMDRAGHAVALAAARAGAGYGTRVSVLAGPGNNGGDGYVAARYLKQRGAFVTIHALAEPTTTEARDAARRAASSAIPLLEFGPMRDADVVIDSVFGGGSRRGLPESVIDWMRTSAPVIAVDYPTGLDPDTGEVEEASFRAVETVTFSTLKTGHVLGRGPDHCGLVTVADIGIEGGNPSMYLAEESDAPRPSRRRKAHKWSAGSVLLLGGSTGMAGALAFAGRSALRFGAGSVYIVTSRVDLLQQIAPELPALDFDEAIERLDRFDVLVAGPGLAERDASAARAIISKSERVVLDAGALTPATLEAAREGGADVVITPHDGEFVRVAGINAGTFAIRSFAGSSGITVLRKGNPTMISDGGLPILVTTGGPELASIGTGDVLSGMIGALWARGLTAIEAAVSGAYWHGVAGAALARRGAVTAPALVETIADYAW